jgi:hypothetical protein
MRRNPEEEGQRWLRQAQEELQDAQMIDVLHRCLLLWEQGERRAIGELLMRTGYGGRDIFWQVAQAISEVLPAGNKERQLLQGFLDGRREYEATVRREAEQLELEM